MNVDIHYVMLVSLDALKYSACIYYTTLNAIVIGL